MAKYGKGDSIGPSATPEEVLDYFLAISTGMTPEEAMRILKNLSRNVNTQLLVGCCVGAAMNVKSKVDETVKKLNISVPESAKINDSISMTFFAMVGHVIMMVPEGYLTVRGRTIKEGYKKSIGGVEDITKFHSGVSMGNKEKRAEILLKWNTTLRTFNVVPYIDLLSQVCPAVVRPRSNILVRTVTGTWETVTAPFRLAAKVATKIVGATWSVLRVFVFFLIFAMMIRIIALGAFPRATSAVIGALGLEAEFDMAAPIAERSFSAAKGSIAFGTQATYGSMRALSVLLSASFKGALATAAMASSVPGLAVKLSTTDPAEILDIISAQDYPALASTLLSEAAHMSSVLFKDTTSALLGASTSDIERLMSSSTLSEVMEFALDDVKALASAAGLEVAVSSMKADASVQDVASGAGSVLDSDTEEMSYLEDSDAYEDRSSFAYDAL